MPLGGGAAAPRARVLRRAHVAWALVLLAGAWFVHLVSRGTVAARAVTGGAVPRSHSDPAPPSLGFRRGGAAPDDTAQRPGAAAAAAASRAPAAAAASPSESGSGSPHGTPPASASGTPPAASLSPSGAPPSSASAVAAAQPPPPAPAPAPAPRTRVVFFAIITLPLQFRRRAIIRKTWLHCLSAHAASLAGPHRIELRYRFFIGQLTPQARRSAEFRGSGGFPRLAREMAAHRDIVPLAAEDRYENLTLKSQMALHWVAREWAAHTGQAPRVVPPARAGAPLPPGWAGTGMEALVDWAEATRGAPRFGTTPHALEGVDEALGGNLSLALRGADGGAPTTGARQPARPWGGAFAGVPPARALLEWVVKTDADVVYCPTHLLGYATGLLAEADGVAWEHKDKWPVLTDAQAAALHGGPGGSATALIWAGKGPYGNKSVIRDPKNYFHIPPAAYPGPVDPRFLPGPSYMLTGPLLRALVGTFPIAPQGVLDPWRGFEDKYLGMLVEQLAAARGAPVAVVGRGEHYMDAADPGRVKRGFCDWEWRTKLGVQVINYNESAPLTQFACEGWEWPGDGAGG